MIEGQRRHNKREAEEFLNMTVTKVHCMPYDI